MFKCLLDSRKAKIGVALGISALIWKKIKQLVVCSKHQNTLEDTRNVVNVVNVVSAGGYGPTDPNRLNVI